MPNSCYLVCFALLLLFDSGYCSNYNLKCYHCSTDGRYHPRCSADVYSSSSRLCLPGEVCIKEEKGSEITRECRLEAVCQMNRGCYACDSELCNSSGILIPSALGISVLYILRQFL